MIKASYDVQQKSSGAQITRSAFGTKSSTETPVSAYIIETPKSRAPQGILVSVLTMLAGLVLALAGILMLVLPGPGLLAIGGGVALIIKGAKGVVAPKKNQDYRKHH